MPLPEWQRKLNVQLAAKQAAMPAEEEVNEDNADFAALPPEMRETARSMNPEDLAQLRRQVAQANSGLMGQIGNKFSNLGLGEADMANARAMGEVPPPPETPEQKYAKLRAGLKKGFGGY